MKNSALIMLAVASVMASSCLGSGGSKSDYVLQASFDGYANEQIFSQYFNSDSVYYAEQILTDQYSCLYSVYPSDSVFYGGFCLSAKKDSLNTDKTDISDYSSAGTDAGYLDSNVYAVYIQNSIPEYGWRIFLSGFDVGTCYMTGFMIDNTSKTIKAIEDNPLEDGDYLTVTVTGYLNETQGESVTVDLVKNTSMTRTVVTGWTEVDLSSLGLVDALSFSVETNRSDFPKSFCMDNLTSKVHVEY
jgi:hypothetical protein